MPVDVQQAYASWAQQYDTNKNSTRDVEALALRTALANINFLNCLEIGCGTGKNTIWLMSKAQQITAVDLSEEMLAKAKEKISSKHVTFKQADINAIWQFADQQYDLITFSLVLEHIEDLNHIFTEAANTLQPGGYIYIGELHPFKQYGGTKARFDSAEGMQIVECYNHHVSDFTQQAKKQGLVLVDVNEYFDSENRDEIPRILTIIFTKS